MIVAKTMTNNRIRAVLKLTKKQTSLIYNKLPGTGEIIINLGGTRLVQIPLNLGKNGCWYTENKKLENWLNDIKSEILEE